MSIEMAVKVISIVVSFNAAYELCTLSNRRLIRIRNVLIRSPITVVATARRSIGIFACVAASQAELILVNAGAAAMQQKLVCRRGIGRLVFLVRYYRRRLRLRIRGAARALFCAVESLWSRVIRRFVLTGSVLERAPATDRVAVEVPDIPSAKILSVAGAGRCPSMIGTYRAGPGDRRNWTIGVDYWSKRTVTAGRST